MIVLPSAFRGKVAEPKMTSMLSKEGKAPHLNPHTDDRNDPIFLM